MSNRAWVTLATNDSYGLGALVLAHSLRRAGSTYPSVVMITPTVTSAMKERLSAVFAEVIVVDVLDSRDAAHLALLQRPELGITFTKLHCWSLTQYEKCVFLDADTLIVQNCDELFEREELSAAPDVGWPDCFNSGVFVFKPSNETFDALIKFAKERGSFDGGDQGLLNSFFSNWAQADITKHLPFLYNVTSAAFYSYLPALQHFGQNLKIIHFIGAAKPWLHSFNWETRSVEGSGHLQSSLQLWWDLFVSSVHPQLDTTMVEVDPPPALPPPDLLHHYEPPSDPNSQFPWHRPEIRNTQEQVRSPLDITQFHDPWENYRGNIPPTGNESQKDQNFTVGRIELSHDLRNHVWENSSHTNNTKNSNTHEFETHRIDKDIYDENASHFQPNINHHHCNNHKEHTHHIEKDDYSEHRPNTNEFKAQNINIISNVNPSNNFNNHTTSNTSNNNNTVENVIPNHIPNGVSNGHTYDGNSIEEDLLPRHPYDGYYLKHIPIVDVRGRKICSHELPPTPPPSPPLDYVLEVENGTEIHSGVAGNLARVAPGPSAVQHDALNELTRRQGWEAGNIDYLGADSFDKIWLKISQTLAQPRTSPPKEVAPTQNDAKVQTLPAETVDVNQPQQTTEAIATPAVQPTVPATETTVVVAEKAPVTAEVPVAPVQAAESPVEAEIPITALEAPAVLVDVPPVKVEVPPIAPEVSPVIVEVPPIAPEVSPVPEVIQEVVDNMTTEVAPEAASAIVYAVPVVAEVQAKTKIVAPESVALSEPESKEESSVVTKEDSKKEATPVISASESKTCESTKSEQVAATPESASDKTPVSDEGETKLCTDVPVPAKPCSAPDAVAPEKTLDLSTASSDSPPLAHTPAKEDVQPPATAKSVGDGKGRKPAEKLQLCPPTHADPLPTPDSELEDAATLAQSIIAGELATPTVTSPTPPAPLTPASPLTDKRLAAEPAVLDTPPAGPVSLAQIGVKTKPTTAEQIASSVEVLPEQPTPPSTPTEPVVPKEAAPKKKIVKKVVKKEAAPAPSGEGGPVPPPRKKEKKPKDK